MRKYLLSLLTMLSMVTVFTSCSSDNNDESNREGEILEASYNRVKTQIVGNWVLDAFYKDNSNNPYVNNGWNKAEETYWHNDKDYRLSFSNSTVNNNKGQTFPYVITIRKEYTTSISNPSEDYYQYIYKKGIILLEYDNNKYVCDIKSDGKLYLYDFQTGLTGTPEYRYRRN